MTGTRFFEESDFLSTLRCGRLPAFSLCVFLRIKKCRFHFVCKKSTKKMVEIPFCVFLRMKMHTKIHFIRKKSTKMTSGGLLGPRPGGVTKSVQKGPGRQLTKNRPNDVSRSHSDGLFEASNFFDFLGGG